MIRSRDRSAADVAFRRDPPIEWTDPPLTIFPHEVCPVPQLNPPVCLKPLALPEFGEPVVEPQISGEVYQARVAAALHRAAGQGLDALIVYGDREHMANVSYLTGYDPRFEEALLILTPGQKPKLLVGNEGWAYAELAPGSFERVLYQSMSLLGQPRGNSPTLPAILADSGIGAGARLGVAGWKYFDASDGMDASALEIPSYIADCLRRVAGPAGLVSNAGAIFMAPDNGLRTLNEVDQLAVFEFAATHTSQALRRVMFGLLTE